MKDTEKSKIQSLINNPDFLRDILGGFLQSLIDQKFESFIDAEKYQRSAHRNGIRNGTYTRSLTTRVGSLTLRIPRDRDGEFSTEIFERYQRSEKAFLLTLVEAYWHGVSTRKVSEIAEALCGETVSKSTISSLTEQLDEELTTWRKRPLTEPYAYVYFDALVERVREGKRVVKMSNVIATGVKEDGYREIIGCGVINSETKTEWSDFIQSLKERGLQVSGMMISDANKGLQEGLSKNYPGVPWQRCQVHFFRNLFDKLPRSKVSKYSEMLKLVYAQPSFEEAQVEIKKMVEDLVATGKEGVADWLEENIPETLNLYSFPKEHRKRIRSTNMIERVNREVRRRSRVISIYPSVDSCLRMLTAICQQISEGWEGRKYLQEEDIK